MMSCQVEISRVPTVKCKGLNPPQEEDLGDNMALMRCSVIC